MSKIPSYTNITRPLYRARRMIWKELDEPVHVIATIRYQPHDDDHKRVNHISIKWNEQWIDLPNIKLYHRIKRGLRISHVYSCTDVTNTCFFRILHDALAQNVYVVGVDGDIP